MNIFLSILIEIISKIIKMLLLYLGHCKQQYVTDKVHIVCNFLDICLINLYIAQLILISHSPLNKTCRFQVNKIPKLQT